MATPSTHAQAGHGEGHGHHPSLGLYIGIWVGLLALTTLTFGVTRVAPKDFHIPAAVLIATTKATLVALFFMHLKYSSGTIRLTLLISVGFVIILMLGILGDIWTRYPLTNAPESDLSGVSERFIKAREAYGPVQEAPPPHEAHPK